MEVVIWFMRVADIGANSAYYAVSTIDLDPIKGVTLGDIDGNGRIEIIDVRLLLQAYINTNWSEADLDVMDMDGNGIINILDVRLLLQNYING